ncbi:MAG: hypothetical protein KDB14_09320 [Planctomycetales bacterium]|nr:hypothetical protein [Planctomycetales bacterium]
MTLLFLAALLTLSCLAAPAQGQQFHEGGKIQPGEKPLNSLMRWIGFGYSDGYHGPPRRHAMGSADGWSWQGVPGPTAGGMQAAGQPYFHQDGYMTEPRVESYPAMEYSGPAASPAPLQVQPTPAPPQPQPSMSPESEQLPAAPPTRTVPGQPMRATPPAGELPAPQPVKPPMQTRFPSPYQFLPR